MQVCLCFVLLFSTVLRTYLLRATPPPLHKPVIWLLSFCTYRIHTVPLFPFSFCSLSLSLSIPSTIAVCPTHTAPDIHPLFKFHIHMFVCLFVCFPLCRTHTIRTCMPIASSAPALLYHYHCFCPSSFLVACILYAFLLSFVGIPECTSMHGCRQLLAFYFEYRSIAMDFLSYRFFSSAPVRQ